MQIVGGCPEICASILRTQNVAPSRQEQSLASAIAQGGSGFLDVAKRTRRPSGPQGGAVRNDVLEKEDADSSSYSGRDNDAWVVYRTAEQRSGRERKEKGGSMLGKDKVKGDGR